MILLDADVLLLDIRYRSDAKFALNQTVLEAIRAEQISVGITAQALLEVVGILSFNVAQANIRRLPEQLQLQYGLSVLPPISGDAVYAGCTVRDVVEQMAARMALGDAVQAVQISGHSAGIECLLTWNAKHFMGKLAVPVMTPQDWLDHRIGNPSPANP